jgi:hypothetical protein
MSGITIVFDATHENISALPPNSQHAGYVTGSGGIAWTADDWKADPNAIRIDQTPANTPWDVTADADDYETAAVGLTELAPRVKLRLAAFKNGTRPGQRKPLVYMSASNVHQVANALVSGGVTSEVGLWVANWNLNEAEAISQVMAAAGPFPIRGVQFRNAGRYDMSVFDGTWVSEVSVAAGNVIASVGSQTGWRFCAKCSGLVQRYGPGICAGGGTHDVVTSHNYTVSWDDFS